MTLVELLVVVAILGLLSVVVLPNLSNPGNARKAREAARAVSGFIANVQSRAIGTRGGSGLWLEPLPNAITDSAGLPHVVVIDLFSAQIPEPYAGEALNSTVLVTPVGASANLTFQNRFQLPANLASLPNMAIRFANSPTSFRLGSVNVNAGSGVATMDTSRNQTAYNTPWPVADVNGISYEVFLPATKEPSVSLTLGNGMAIDLAWSGVGTERFGPAPLAGDDGYPTLPGYNPGQALALMFDSAGAVAEVVFLNTALSGARAEVSVPVRGPILLLVGRIDRCGLPYHAAPTEDSPGANWQYADSMWIAIDPKTGLARSVPPAIHIQNQPVTNARDSQSFVRSAP